MSTLLNFDTVSKGRVTDPSFIHIKSVVKKYSTQIRFRVLDTNRFLPRDHMLVKLVQNLGLQPWMDDESLKFRIREAARTLATAYRVTYHNNFGELHDSAIIPGCTEALIFTVEENNVPLNILYHNYHNLNWEIGDGNNIEPIAFIEINLYALAKLYLKWLGKRAMGLEDNLYNFMYKHVWYTMLPKYMDLALYNKHVYRGSGYVLPKDSKPIEYKIPQIADRIDRHIDVITSLNSKRRLNLSGVLESYQLFNLDTALDLIPPEPNFLTTQSRWIYTLSRLPYIYNSIDSATKNKSNAINKRWVGGLNRFIKTFRQAQSLNRLPLKHRSSLYAFVDRLDRSISRI